MATEKADVLSDALLQLQGELDSYKDLYQALEEAKEKIASAESLLKSRAEDQWKANQAQLDSMSRAVTAIDVAAGQSKQLAESLIAVADGVNRVNFPDRLDRIDQSVAGQLAGFNDFQTSQATRHAETLTRYEELSMELGPIANDLPDRVMSLGEALAAQKIQLAELEKMIAQKLSELTNEIRTSTIQLAARHDSANLTLSTLATTLHSLQTATGREFGFVHTEIKQCSSDVAKGFTSSSEVLTRITRRISLHSAATVFNTVLLIAVLWVLFGR